jgi:hypothetical protein
MKNGIYKNAIMIKYMKEKGYKVDTTNEGLKKWFAEKWINVDEFLKGNIVACGRTSANKGKYPVCRPLKKVDKKTPPTTAEGAIGITNNATNLAQKSASITGQIKNVLVTKIGESTNEYIRPKTTSEIGGSVQSSALVFSGPSLKDIKNKKITPRNLVTYIPKELTEKYVHFGTRLRIIGRPDNVKKKEFYTVQKAENGIDLYDKVKLTGGSAGIAFMLDTSTDRNNGYYFEISALSYDGTNTDALDNVFFHPMHFQVCPG